jgi:hypothetical protein
MRPEYRPPGRQLPLKESAGLGNVIKLRFGLHYSSSLK